MHKLNPAQREVFEELDAVSAEAAKQYLFEEIERLNQLVEELLKEKDEQNGGGSRTEEPRPWGEEEARPWG